MGINSEEEKLVTVLEKAIIFGEESLSPEERRIWDVGMEFPQIRSTCMMVKASVNAYKENAKQRLLALMKAMKKTKKPPQN